MVMNLEEPYYWIWGLTTDSRGNEVWHPLYCYSNGWRAKRIFNLIFDLDDLPREIAHYEDFKMEQDNDPSYKKIKNPTAPVETPKGKKPASGKIVKKKGRR